MKNKGIYQSVVITIGSGGLRPAIAQEILKARCQKRSGVGLI